MEYEIKESLKPLSFNPEVCKDEAPPYLDSAGVELTTDDLVYVTEDVHKMFRGEETLMAAGSLALIFSFPKPGRACILGTFVNEETGMRYQAKKIVERTVLTRIAKRFMRRKYDPLVAELAGGILTHAVQ